MADWQTNGNLTVAGDFLGTTNDAPLAVRTNDVERLRVLGDGRIGVGLSDPRAALHVMGGIATGLEQSAGGAISFLAADGLAAFHIDNGPDSGRAVARLRFSHGPQPGSNELMTLAPTGNVGIGLIAPAVKLHVAGDRIRLESDGRQLDLRSDGAAVDVATTTSNLYLHSLGPSGRNHVVINPFPQSGNVGVGLHSPEVKFHVVGDRIRLESGGKRLDLRSDGTEVEVEARRANLILQSLGPRGRNHVVINHLGGSGNVGIGLSAPQVALHVFGDRIRLNQGKRQIDLRADGSHVDVEARTSDLYLHSLGPRGRNHVIINPFSESGNVGIGTTVPTDKLHVVGIVRADDFIVTSDARLKSGMRPLRGALDRIRKLRGVEFRWKRARQPGCPPPGETRWGVVAQEVESVAPQLVHRAGGPDGPGGVNLGGMLATLVEAVKELAADNDRLSRRLDGLEASVRAGGAS